jgi:hypothetical protein
VQLTGLPNPRRAVMQRAITDVPGLWTAEPDTIAWTYNGVPCHAARNRFGAWCGYAGVDPQHPWYRREYQEWVPDPTDADEIDGEYSYLPIEVHGGCTFSEWLGEADEFAPSPFRLWWFGFDCGHASDYIPLATWRDGYGWRTELSRYRDLGYVVRETERLAAQVREHGRIAPRAGGETPRIKEHEAYGATMTVNAAERRIGDALLTYVRDRFADRGEQVLAMSEIIAQGAAHSIGAADLPDDATALDYFHSAETFARAGRNVDSLQPSYEALNTPIGRAWLRIRAHALRALLREAL